MMAREPATAQGTRALAHFDHALDASLVVSYLALRQGDAVGLYATGGDERWVAPQRSLGAIDTPLRARSDLQPQQAARPDARGVGEGRVSTCSSGGEQYPKN